MGKPRHGFIVAVPADTGALSGVFSLDEQKNLLDDDQWAAKISVTALVISGGGGGSAERDKLINDAYNELYYGRKSHHLSSRCVFEKDALDSLQSSFVSEHDAQHQMFVQHWTNQNGPGKNSHHNVVFLNCTNGTWPHEAAL